MAPNLEELADIAILMHEMGVDIWEVFFLIATGRGTEVIASSPSENDDICNFLVDASRYGFTVRTVEAPFFRRIVVQRRDPLLGPSVVESTGALYARLRDRLVSQLGEPNGPARTTTAATRDGKGVIFVAANGDVYPSGFLPVSWATSARRVWLTSTDVIPCCAKYAMRHSRGSAEPVSTRNSAVDLARGLRRYWRSAGIGPRLPPG